MFYRSLSLSQRILVPLLCSMFFLYYFWRYRKTSMPKGIIYSNICFFIGCFLLACCEYLKQKHLIKILDSYIFPFIHLDFIIFTMIFGATIGIKGSFSYKKFQSKRGWLYYLLILLVALTGLYIYIYI